MQKRSRYGVSGTIPTTTNAYVSNVSDRLIVFHIRAHTFPYHHRFITFPSPAYRLNYKQGRGNDGGWMTETRLRGEIRRFVDAEEMKRRWSADRRRRRRRGEGMCANEKEETISYLSSPFRLVGGNRK